MELPPYRGPSMAKRDPKHPLVRWVVLICCIIGIALLGYQWFRAVRFHGEAGFQALETTASALRQQDFDASAKALLQARQHFTQGTRLLFGMEHLLPVLDQIPGCSLATSGIALMQAGDHLTRGAELLLAVARQSLGRLREPSNNYSLLDFLHEGEDKWRGATLEMEEARKLLAYVHPESLPSEQQETFAKGEKVFSATSQMLTLSVQHIDLLEEILGQNGPRLYLFLFQNNHELRPTGGFIGSYALLDINAGRIRRFFVDGIFNPDGQLKENIVPPAPMQKISAGWSLHDSNWFPDFPTSAEKARFFYEKTGGPTTDGVITLTPEVLRRLLTIVGPVDMPEYGITVDADNFLPIIQEEVELKYNQEENNPKRILGDLAGKLLERLVVSPSKSTAIALADTLVSLLNERHILLYARDERAESLITDLGWSGAMLATPYDYLSVVHTNINGYKTDGVITDAIRHQASIQSDGSVIDTVTVRRTHRGGDTPYPWWNKVNANYMRVYVPLGSELLAASGMTREFPEPPLDYEALHFRRDETVVEEESRVTIDEESGTRIGEEFGKTVFGNWVYVSPGETVEVTYRYRLPFRVMPSQPGDEALPFSILYQKQSGTKDWQLTSVIERPERYTPIWQSPENLVPYGRTLTLTTDLNHNVFVGVVFKNSIP